MLWKTGFFCKFPNAQSAFENLHVDPLFSKHGTSKSRIQSSYLFFIKIIPFKLRNNRFNTKRVAFRTAACTHATRTVSSQDECQILSYVYCAPLLADIFLYSYEADFIQSLLSTGKKHLASRFNLTYRYIDDVLSINNPEFENYLGQMYPAELEIKDTTESTTSASYLDLLLSIGRDGQLHTSIYDKRDDFNFHITNFPFLSSNIPSSPAYGVFISQLIRYARACSSYECFILRARRLSSKLLKQGYLVERLKSSFRKFYGRYGDLVEQYGVTLSRMLNDILTLDQQWPPYQSDFPPISWPLYRAWPSPNYEWFPWSICNGCG